MLNGAILHPAEGWVASNTPASVFGMVLKSRVLSTQLQIIPQRPHVDLRQRAMSVYHVALATGDVKLCCVRNIHWDLQLMHYNGDAPLPREIQSLLEPK